MEHGTEPGRDLWSRASEVGLECMVEVYRAFKQQGPALEFTRMREDYCKVPACFEMG